MSVVVRRPVGASPEQIAEGDRLLADLHRLQVENPLHRFHVCEVACGEPGCKPRPKQRKLMEASTPIQAAFAGNRFGKTATTVGKCYLQHLPDELIPARLREFKCVTHGMPVQGRILCAGEKQMLSSLLPTMKQWVPRAALRGGTWDKAWDKQHHVLHFADGGFIGVYTYSQDAEVMAGSALDYVAYDEPPPEDIRNECLMRLVDRDGFEVFALTPVNMRGGGIGWLYRKIWKQRDAPHITVVKGSGFDNPSIDPVVLRRQLDNFPEEERQAREHGDFMHVGGMVYAGGFEKHLVPPLTPDQLKDRDVVVGIDPGMKCAAFVWLAFDEDNRAVVFDEAALSGATVVDYMLAIITVNARWGLLSPDEAAQASAEVRRRHAKGEMVLEAFQEAMRLLSSPSAPHAPLYVIDPSARNRTLTNAESVQAELQRQGIYPIPGQNDVFAGVSQARRRLQQGGLFIAENCRHLRSEAEEYRLEDRPDGEFKIVKEDDHRLDAMRYALMQRPWYAQPQEPEQPLGWTPGSGPSAQWMRQHRVPEDTPFGKYA